MSTDRFTAGDSWVSAELPEDAGIISDRPTGFAYPVYEVSLDGRGVGIRRERDDAEQLLAETMDAAEFWPDCFYVNERGNVTQLIRVSDDDEPSTFVAIESELAIESRECQSCGKSIALPLDGDPTRRCPHCEVLVNPAYVVVVNMPGYLPESEPSYAATLEEAREIARGELSLQAPEHDESPAYFRALDEARADLGEIGPAGGAVSIPGSEYVVEIAPCDRSESTSAALAEIAHTPREAGR